MNSKTLLLLGIVGAVAASSATAQVYSVNAVGYVNKTIPAGFSLVASPLNASVNKVSGVFNQTSGTPVGTSVYKFNSANSSFSSIQLDTTGWVDANTGDPADLDLSPGEGVFILANSQFVNTFVGEVPTGNLSTPVPAGFSVLSSKVPQASGLKSVLGLNPGNGDTVYFFRSGAYVASAYDAGSWVDNDGNPLPEPVPQVAEAFFFLNNGPATTWTRQFSIN